MAKKIKFEDLILTFPESLQVEILMIVYKDAIQKVKFLRNKGSQFYSSILQKIKSVQFKKGDFVIRQNSRPTECFIVVSGTVINLLSKRSFGEGSIFGITDIIYKRKRIENFVAVTDVSLLMFSIAHFEEMLGDYPEIKKEVEMLAKGRDELVQAVIKGKKADEEVKRKAQMEELIKHQMV